MKTLIAIGVVAIFTMIGFVFLNPLFGNQSPLRVLLVTSLAFGVPMGIRLANVLSRMASRHEESRKRRPARRPPRIGPNPIPFQERLAQLTERPLIDGEDPETPRISRMRFWMANIPLQRSPPKHPSSIQAILYRIRLILTAAGK